MWHSGCELIDMRLLVLDQEDGTLIGPLSDLLGPEQRLELCQNHKVSFTLNGSLLRHMIGFIPYTMSAIKFLRDIELLSLGLFDRTLLASNIRHCLREEG
jgi:hypothetical protein